MRPRAGRNCRRRASTANVGRPSNSGRFRCFNSSSKPGFAGVTATGIAGSKRNLRLDCVGFATGARYGTGAIRTTRCSDLGRTSEGSDLCGTPKFGMERQICSASPNFGRQAAHIAGACSRLRGGRTPRNGPFYDSVIAKNLRGPYRTRCSESPIIKKLSRRLSLMTLVLNCCSENKALPEFTHNP